jgi:glycosyltransferase involved in cell wall biosynthesis
MNENLSFAVAICTWNRASLLRQTLERLAGIPWPAQATELILVDNGSTDDTPAVAASFSSRLPMRIVREADPGLSNARNRALKEATTTHVLFTDDDVLVSDEWLGAFAAAILKYPQAAVFGGPIEPWFQESPARSLAEAFPMLSSGFCGLDHGRAEGVLPAPLEVYGANMAFRRAALGNLRFDPRMGPSRGASVTSEETALIDQIRSAGSEVVWVPLMQVKHYVDPRRMRLLYLLRYCHELAMGQVMRHGAPEGATIAGVPRWVLRVTARHAARAFWKALTGDRIETLVSLRTCSYFSGIARQSYRSSHPGRATA